MNSGLTQHSLFSLQNELFLSPIVILENAYQQEIPATERPLLNELNETWKVTRPFSEKKVLVNAHLTLITLDLVRLLIAAGAEVHVTASKDLAVHENTTVPLVNANIPLYLNAEIPESLRNGYFDVVFDCGAGMLNLITPNIGMVELTHTAPSLYDGITFPVVTVDTSRTKKLETTLGTGDALVRVLVGRAEMAFMTALQGFISVSDDKLFDMQQQKNLFLTMIEMVTMNGWIENGYLIVGYGKVGQGIVGALRNAGVSHDRIFIAEVDVDKAVDAQREGYKTFDIADPVELALLKGQLSCIGYVITATGVSGAISRYFSPEDFDPKITLINMGTPDEYGENFPPARVLNEKKAANFMLAYPTQVKYLDPIFSILAQAAESLILRNLNSGLQGVSPETDSQVLRKWKKIWGTTVEQPQKKLHDELKVLYAVVSTAQNNADSRLKVCQLLAQYGAFQVSLHHTTLACFSPHP